MFALMFLSKFLQIRGDGVGVITTRHEMSEGEIYVRLDRAMYYEPDDTFYIAVFNMMRLQRRVEMFASDFHTQHEHKIVPDPLMVYEKPLPKRSSEDRMTKKTKSLHQQQELKARIQASTLPPETETQLQLGIRTVSTGIYILGCGTLRAFTGEDGNLSVAKIGVSDTDLGSRIYTECLPSDLRAYGPVNCLWFAELDPVVCRAAERELLYEVYRLGVSFCYAIKKKNEQRVGLVHPAHPTALASSVPTNCEQVSRSGQGRGVPHGCYRKTKEDEAARARSGSREQRISSGKPLWASKYLLILNWTDQTNGHSA